MSQNTVDLQRQSNLLVADRGIGCVASGRSAAEAMLPAAGSRRAFLARAAAAAAGIAAAPFASRVFAQGCAQPPGVQLYTIREALNRDAEAALGALSAMGLREAELYGLSPAMSESLFGLSVAAFRELVERNGLGMPISHIGGDLSDIPETAALARALGIPAVVVALPTEFTESRDGRFAMVGAKSREQLDRLAEKLDRTGRAYRDEGLAFGYHNHNVEFLALGGLVPFDYLMERTDPDLVRIELDVGWLALAGGDPVAYLRRYAGRIIACHLKDYDPGIDSDVPQRKLVPPGDGTVDFGAVLEAMDAAGVAHGFVEIDVADDPLAAVERGHRHLEALRDC
jgi:sugar phosphate isomerase/epimerase